MPEATNTIRRAQYDSSHEYERTSKLAVAVPLRVLRVYYEYYWHDGDRTGRAALLLLLLLLLLAC
jgi:hypothetical protein